MLPIQSIEAPTPSNTADENGEGRQQKPKTLPCKYCSKRFRRVEHVQRHERTHTKEKPFSCTWDRCGKTFGRRDLLVRHEKLVHLNEGSKDSGRARKQSSGNLQPMAADIRGNNEALNVQHQGQHSQQQQPPRPPPPQFTPESMTSSVVSSLQTDPRLTSRPGCNLDLLSDAATHLASTSEVNQIQQQSMMTDMGPQSGNIPRAKPYDDGLSYQERPREQDQSMMHPGFPTHQQPPAASFDDYNLFLDDMGTSSHFLPPALESEQSFGLWNRHGGDLHVRGSLKPPGSFPSTRFPSLQPDAHEGSRIHEDGLKAPFWKISGVDYNVIKNRLDEFSSVIPNDFIFPSRHTLMRFLEGYNGGFHEHLPILHTPTLAPAELSPELLLAILAVGAQYRFESHRGNALWYASKAVAMEQIRRRHSHEVHGLLPTPAAYSPHSTRPSPSSGYRHSFNSVHHDRPMTQETHREPYSPNTPQSRLETIQALILLFAVGLWGAKAILHDALSLQSQIALLVREERLVSEPAQAVDWETWIRIEGAVRTKLIAYCFFNLCSIAYNTPPLLLTSEVNLTLPNSSRLWRADTAWQWQEARQSYPSLDVSLQDGFSRLLNRPSQGALSHVSSLGNYVLIHALIQHIYLLKQTSFAIASPFEVHRGLKVEDVEDVAQALRVWQMGFEQQMQSRNAADSAAAGGTSHPSQHQQQMDGGFGSGGPVAFNSTALLRLAYFRLYSDLSPCRTLETRDHLLVANDLAEAPLPSRNPRLHRAIYQAIHSLAVLVKVGVNYVARTKSLEWSMQHSICNLECAVLLSKWLLTLASIGPNEPAPSQEERTILDTVRTMVNETEFAVPIDPSLASSGSSQQTHPSTTDPARLRQLAAAVIRLWAETFKGSHIFDIIRVMAQGLEGYADLIEKPRDRTPLGRMAPGQSMG
ncbi:hypothetical protein ACKVWC_007950 [Pyricularia oryzae]|nr:hypothetical protein MCOR13_008753 [Pyricularia oryzae]